MEFDNDTIFDIVECWTAGFVCIGILYMQVLWNI